MVQYRLVETTSSDEAWLDDLRRRAYRDLFVETWGGWDEERHVRHFHACLRRGHISAIEVAGDRVGMIQTLTHAGHVEIAEIQVDPRFQGRGIGTIVLRDVLSSAGDESLAVRLSVGRRNQKAIHLYHRLGFELVERSATHYHMQREAPT